jgi:hypothetical protein
MDRAALGRLRHPYYLAFNRSNPFTAVCRLFENLHTLGDTK